MVFRMREKGGLTKSTTSLLWESQRLERDAWDAYRRSELETAHRLFRKSLDQYHAISDVKSKVRVLWAMFFCLRVRYTTLADFLLPFSAMILSIIPFWLTPLIISSVFGLSIDFSRFFLVIGALSVLLAAACYPLQIALRRFMVLPLERKLDSQFQRSAQGAFSFLMDYGYEGLGKCLSFAENNGLSRKIFLDRKSRSFSFFLDLEAPWQVVTSIAQEEPEKADGTLMEWCRLWNYLHRRSAPFFLSSAFLFVITITTAAVVIWVASERMLTPQSSAVVVLLLAYLTPLGNAGTGLLRAKRYLSAIPASVLLTYLLETLISQAIVGTAAAGFYVISGVMPLAPFSIFFQGLIRLQPSDILILFAVYLGLAFVLSVWIPLLIEFLRHITFAYVLMVLSVAVAVKTLTSVLEVSVPASYGVMASVLWILIMFLVEEPVFAKIDTLKRKEKCYRCGTPYTTESVCTSCKSVLRCPTCNIPMRSVADKCPFCLARLHD